jgi:hypothetical protein
MASSSSSTPGPAAGDDLDQLLDSALDDFATLDLAAAPNRSTSTPNQSPHDFLD